MIDDKFSKLLNDYKQRQEKREGERQGRAIKFAWDEIARRCNIPRKKFGAWQQGYWTPESRKTDGKKNAFKEVQRLADFFELTKEERVEFFQAAGFDDIPDEEATEEPKALYYFSVKGLLTQKHKKKVLKLIRQIDSLFSEPSQTVKLEIEGEEITDEQLEKILEEIRHLSDDPQITLIKEKKS